MREREEEIKNIHRGMHQVNEIYKVGADVDLIFHVCVCAVNNLFLNNFCHTHWIHHRIWHTW